MPKKRIILDTETTGFTPGVDELLQLSMISDSGRVLFNRYFKPDNHQYWIEAERVNHISPAMVMNEKSFFEYVDIIQNLINKADEIIGYNVEFDLKHLEANGIKIPKRIKIVDIMRDFAPIYGERSSWGTYKWKKLVECANYYGYDWNSHIEAHNSLGDCYATLYCYWRVQDDMKRLGIL